MRKIFLVILAILVTVGQAQAASGIIAGAIRWDAWYNPTGNSLLAQNNLGPPVYQSRAPIHCARGSQTINCVGTQAAMDAEITAAVSGGLKYWAFDQYDSGSSLTTGWNLYQSSTIKNQINWCWLTQLSDMGSTGSYTAQMNLLTAHMQQTNYQKVTVGATANRPVFYILWTSADFANFFGSNYANVAAMFTYLRAQVTAAGLGTPYIIIMVGSNVTTGATIVTNTGADAQSSYTTPLPLFPPAINPTFPALDTLTQAFWVTEAAAGVPIVPNAMIGWLPTPRITRPSTLNAGQIPYIGVDELYSQATNAQLITHLAAAVAYINANSAIVPSKLLLIYSWTECDEGGCLTPTFGDPTGSKLTAIQSTIN